MWSGIIYFFILPYLFIGVIILPIYFKRWHDYEQFSLGVIGTPIAILVGLVLWPLVIKKARCCEASIETQKKRLKTALAKDHQQ